VSVAGVGTVHGLSRQPPATRMAPTALAHTPQLTEYKKNADSEQDHGEHQPPDPQALVICGEETEGLVPGGLREGSSLFRSPSHTPAHPSPRTAMLTIVKGVLLLLLGVHWKQADKGMSGASLPAEPRQPPTAPGTPLPAGAAAPHPTPAPSSWRGRCPPGPAAFPRAPATSCVREALGTYRLPRPPAPAGSTGRSAPPPWLLRERGEAGSAPGRPTEGLGCAGVYRQPVSDCAGTALAAHAGRSSQAGGGNTRGWPQYLVP